MKNIFKTNNKYSQLAYSFLMIIITLFFSIGYGAAANVVLNISNNALAKKPNQPFILNATLSNSVGSDTSQDSFIFDDNTFANLNLSLSNTNSQSSVTYTVTLFNPTDDDYYFDDVLYSLGPITYSNENIVFELDGIDSGDKISSGDSKIFNITFKYDNQTLPSSNSLQAILNFRLYNPNILSKNWAVLSGFKSSYNNFASSSMPIQSISFYSDGSSFSSTPIDVSEKQDGSILLYKELNSSTNKYDVKISSNDKIYFPEDSSYFFASYSILNQINFNNSVSTNLVRDMSNMFYLTGNSSTTFTIDLSDLETSNVVTMKSMFFNIGHNATTWSIGNISNWNTNKVTNMSYMFYGAGYSASTFNLNLNNFDTSNVENMSFMFYQTGYNATTWNIGDISDWNTNKVTDMSYMFYTIGHRVPTLSLNLSNWNTSGVTNMSGMFQYFSGRKIYIGENWDVSNVTSSTNMFEYASNLPNYSSSNITDKTYAKSECEGGYLTVVGEVCPNRVLSSDWAVLAGLKSTYDGAADDSIPVQSITFYSNGSSFSGTPIDVSEDQDGSILFYKVYNSSTSKYDIKICANNTILFPEDSSYLFANYLELSAIDFNNSVDTSSMNNSSWMFRNTAKDASSFNTDIGNWDTSNVTDMSHMFYHTGENATYWHIGDISNWSTGSVTNLSYLFRYAGYNSSSFEIGDISNWDTSNVTDMKYMFAGAGYAATTWNVGSLNNWITQNVTDMSYMFSYSGSPSNFNLSIGNWDTNLTTNMSRMFEHAGPNAIEVHLDLSNWAVGYVTNMSHMFDSMAPNATLVDLNLSGWDASSVTNMSHMFESMVPNATLVDLNLSGWDASSVTNMKQMFYHFGMNCDYISLNLSNWNTSSAEDMSYMFEKLGYSATTFNLNINGWLDTSNVTDMSYMFYSAGYSATLFSVSGIDVLDTSSVTNMSDMFSNFGFSSDIFILDLSLWNTSNVTNMNNMFLHTGYLASTFDLNLSNWSTSNVTSMGGMFFEICQNASQVELDLSSFDTSNVINMSNMFTNFTGEKIYIGENWNTGNVTESISMLSGTINLPNYSSSDTHDKTVAKSECDGGYLTVVGELCPEQLNHIFSYSGSSSIKELPEWQYEMLTDGVLTVDKNVNVDIFCVGGGGGGGGSIYQQAVGGGGGAGGYTSTITATLQAGKQYNVTIGAGGTGGTGAASSGNTGAAGGNTSITTIQDGTIISAQGGQGGGGAYSYSSGSCSSGCAGNGGSGGSGGGGGGKNYSSTNKGGDGGSYGENGQSGGSPTYTNVGNYTDLGRAYSTGSGVPGYGGLGQTTTTCAFGESNGSECVSGYDAFAGGGGGGSGYRDKNYGLGGKANADLYIGGQGGSVKNGTLTAPTSGTVNTGSGGGGGVRCTSGKYTAAGCIGADGGSGICIIRAHK